MAPDRRRLVIAFAFALAIHEVGAGLIPSASSAPESPSEIVEHVQITRIAVRPAAPPTPTPTPPPAPARVIANPQVAGRSAHLEIQHRSGAARPTPPKIVHTKPVWDVPTGAQGAGAGRESGAGSLGRGGTGTGAGTSGNGTAGATAPCGAVDFEKLAMQTDATGERAWVTVRMIVHFPDGHVETAALDYPFYYASEHDNPFVNDSVPMLMQSPPAGKRTGEPALVQYVMEHSNGAGYTLLPDCPG